LFEQGCYKLDAKPTLSEHLQVQVTCCWK